MKIAKVLFSVFITILLTVNVAVAQNWQTIYQTDFSTDPGWVTNNPSILYWDSSDSTYYVNQINVPYGGNYAYYDVGYDGGSFLLEGDVFISYTEYASAITFGLFDSDYHITDNSSYVTIAFVRDDQGNSTYLEWFGSEQGSSQSVSEFSSDWELDTWYHVTIEYNNDDNTLTADVSLQETGVPLLSLNAAGVGPFATDMGLLGNSNVRDGSYQVPWAQFIGKFDNVSYSLKNPNCQIVYESDFSTDPSWETNNPANYYWDAGNQWFVTDNYTNSDEYATTDITYNGESFEFSFDLKPVRESGDNGDICVGLYGPNRESHSGTEERLYMILGGYSPEFLLQGQNSGGEVFQSTLGPWVNNEWHHFEITFDAATNIVALHVTRNSNTVFDWSMIMTSGFSSTLSYLGVSMIGGWETSGRHMDAYLDNVSLCVEGEPGSDIIPVAFDIKPGSCPNPLNVKTPGPDWIWIGDSEDEYSDQNEVNLVCGKPTPGSMRLKKSVIPMAILGTADFDVSQIDLTTVTLLGVSPLRSNIEDVATPIATDATECECNDFGPDGFVDLTLKFGREEIITALGAVFDGDIISLTISGQLLDGTEFEGVDCVLIRGDDPASMVISELPITNTHLVGNAPNPFNPTTTISFNMATNGQVNLSVYNIAGQKVKTLLNESFQAGLHNVIWDGRDESGRSAASGIYFYRLETADFTESKRMVLLK